MSTDADTSLEVWELTLPADEAKCASTKKDCDGPAEWHTHMTPCGHGTALCTPCKDHEVRLRALCLSVRCSHCHTLTTSWMAVPI
jgi:hypothetical protein